MARSMPEKFSPASLITYLRDSILPRLSIRFDKSPIDTVGKLGFFVHTRSAYVAQTSLYGYLKTRMGTKFRDMFQDDVYVKSIDFAKWRVFAACLSDLTIFVSGLIAKEANLSREDTMGLARDLFDFCLRETFEDCDDPALRIAVANAFHERIESVVWANVAIGEEAFSKSPKDLIAFAPIADELKRYDEKIVRNSIRFRWRDVRQQMRKRIAAEQIVADWRG